MQGVINVLKPPGMTSHDVVSFVRRILKEKKVGHTGTLDPHAAGILPVCVGQATRLADLISGSEKEYLCRLTLGAATTTQDAWGELLERKDYSGIRQADIEEALPFFTGEVMQVVPMYSAVKIDGVPLYRRARRGETVERQARKVHIKKIVPVEYDLPHLTLLVVCSQGTYIRTLCHDIGQRLGAGAYMSFLLRTRVGGFLIDDSLTLEEIAEQKEKSITPVINCLPGLARLTMDEGILGRVRSGQSVFLPRRDLEQLGVPEQLILQQCGSDEQKLIAALDAQGMVRALGVMRPEKGGAVFKPHRVFNVE